MRPNDALDRVHHIHLRMWDGEDELVGLKNVTTWVPYVVSPTITAAVKPMSLKSRGTFIRLDFMARISVATRR